MLSRTLIVPALAAALVTLAPALAFAAPITGLTTSSDDLAAGTADDYSVGSQDLNFHTGGAPDNLYLENFTIGAGVDLVTLESLGGADRAEFRRVDNANVSGSRQILWYQIDQRSGDTYDLNPSRATGMQDALLGPIINRGTDNVFTNGDVTNANNIERIDYVFDSGLTAQNLLQLDFGFAIMERGGNDDFAIAAITGLDGGGNPNAYALFRVVTTADYGGDLVGMRTAVVRGDDPGVSTEYGVTADVTGQSLRGMFFTLADLGIIVGQTIYGYSLFSDDVNPLTPGVDLTDVTTFPTINGSGLDLVSGGLAFNPSGADTTGFVNAMATPEPGTYALFGLGLLGLASVACRRRKRAAATASA